MKKSMLVAGAVAAVVFASCRKDVQHRPNENGLAETAVAAASQNNLLETEAPLVQVMSNKVGNNVSGYIAGLPARYEFTTKNYPLLVFIHGMGQLANGNAKLSSVQGLGVTKLLSEQKFPASFTVKGQTHSFIVVSPQFNQYPTADDVNSLIDYLVQTYRVDASRIYVAGLNMGGAAAWDIAGAHSDKIAAIVPIAAPSWADEKRCANIASNGIGVWAFHNSEDKVVASSISKSIVDKINTFSPAAAAKLTEFSSAEHDAWTQATDPNYKENGMNIYEWMLQFSKSSR